MQALIEPFDERALCYPWAHPDPRVDWLHEDVLTAVRSGQARSESRRAIFTSVWALAHRALGEAVPPLPEAVDGSSGQAIPYVSEPWYY